MKKVTYICDLCKKEADHLFHIAIPYLINDNIVIKEKNGVAIATIPNDNVKITIQHQHICRECVCFKASYPSIYCLEGINTKTIKIEECGDYYD